MLLARVPEPPSSASEWHLCEGFHWRLHVHHRTRHTVGLTVSAVRESRRSNVRIGLRLRLWSDHLQKPVRNVALPSKESVPHERHVDVQLPACVASKSAKFLPIAAPFARFVVGISLDVQECCLAGGSRIRRATEYFETSEVVERFGDAYRTGRTISWLKGTDSCVDVGDLNTMETAHNHDEKSEGLTGTVVPYNLRTLLESCNRGEQCRPSDTTFSDVTLMVGSGSNTRTFNLHRCILALASPVFRAMLTSDMLEGRTGIISLPNFTPNGVGVAVRHIYGSPVDITQHAFELYHFAHQFDILRLRHTARKAILQGMVLRSSTHVLRFGVAFRDEEVVKTACSFMAARFTDIMGDDVAAREMYYVPKTTFLRLLGADVIKATEFEILLLALRWLVMNAETDLQEVLPQIRWGLLTPEILDLVECAGLSMFSRAPQAMRDNSADVQSRALHESDIVHRRCLGKPNATLWVPLISRPPTAFFPRLRAMKTDKKQRTRPRVRVETSKSVETSFDRGNLRWALRAKLDECNTSSCCGSRLSASLWLEEGDDGRVWADGREDPLPVRVTANLMVWNHLGGLLHVVPIDVVFRSAGWCNGWCVRDLMDGAKHGLAEYGDAAQVAVEIREIAPV